MAVGYTPLIPPNYGPLYLVIDCIPVRSIREVIYAGLGMALKPPVDKNNGARDPTMGPDPVTVC